MNRSALKCSLNYLLREQIVSLIFTKNIVHNILLCKGYNAFFYTKLYYIINIYKYNFLNKILKNI